MNQINRVAIVGGTHGNEFTGAYLIQKFAQFPHLIRRPSFETVSLLANPNAFAARRRYLEKDIPFGRFLLMRQLTTKRELQCV